MYLRIFSDVDTRTAWFLVATAPYATQGRSPIETCADLRRSPPGGTLLLTETVYCAR